MYRPLSLKKSFLTLITALVLLSFLFSSCGTTRPYTYMQGSFDTAALSKVKITDPVIQKGDVISITVFSDNPDATKIFNQSLAPAGGGATIVNSSTPPGYLIDGNGDIDFQGLGLLHIEGLTISKLKQLLDSKLKDTLLLNPYYTVRFLNYRFTMLGEIGRPGIFNIPSDHINLLEAFAMGGDLTYFSRRDNILIIREQNGKREWGRLDVTKPDIMASPYFYLQQNDIVIVEQNRKKSASSDQLTTRNLGIITTIVSTLVVLYSLLRK